MQHDPRLIEPAADFTDGHMQIQCLNCGCVFRDNDYASSSTLLNCEQERAARANGNIACMPMMVSSNSKKYDPTGG